MPSGSLIGDKANSAVFDNSKIKRFVPDFDCRVTWAEGVRRSLAWFEADPARRTIDEEANGLWDKILAAYLPAFPNPWRSTALIGWLGQLKLLARWQGSCRVQRARPATSRDP